MKGTISICRQTSSQRPDCIHIEVNDESSHCRMIDIEMSPEVFGLVVTGLSCQECDFEIGNTENAGKIREVKEEIVPVTMSKPAGQSDKYFAAQQCKSFTVDGWEPRLDDFGNHHRHLYVGDGNVSAYRVVFTRFVDAPAGEPG